MKIANRKTISKFQFIDSVSFTIWQSTMVLIAIACISLPFQASIAKTEKIKKFENLQPIELASEILVAQAEAYATLRAQSTLNGDDFKKLAPRMISILAADQKETLFAYNDEEKRLKEVSIKLSPIQRTSYFLYLAEIADQNLSKTPNLNIKLLLHILTDRLWPITSDPNYSSNFFGTKRYTSMMKVLDSIALPEILGKTGYAPDITLEDSGLKEILPLIVFPARQIYLGFDSVSKCTKILL